MKEHGIEKGEKGAAGGVGGVEWPLEPVISQLIREEIRAPEGVDVVVGVGGAIVEQDPRCLSRDQPPPAPTGRGHRTVAG